MYFSAVTSATAGAPAATTKVRRKCAITPRAASRRSVSRAKARSASTRQAAYRCEEGPCVVVYPDAVWYTYVDQSDIDEIIEEHLQNGRIVERLRM
jgi:(2Fe-2S) ferredoxin